MKKEFQFENFYMLRRIGTHPRMLKASTTYGECWKPILDQNDNAYLDQVQISAKMVVLLRIITECQNRNELVLIFSQSTEVLETVKFFLQKEDWKNGEHYFCLTGKTTNKVRKQICQAFGAEEQRQNMFPNARLVLHIPKHNERYI